MIPMELLAEKLKRFNIFETHYFSDDLYAAIARNKHCTDLGNPHIIHILTDTEFEESASSIMGGFFIVGNHFPKDSLANKDYIVLNPDTDIPSLIEECHLIFSEYLRYLQYKERLSVLVKKQSPFHEIFDCFAGYYDNPVTFGDRGGNILYRGNIREDYTEWDDEIKYWLELGYVPFNYQKEHGVLQDSRLTYITPEPYIRSTTESRKYRRMLYRACQINNEYNNVFAIVEVYTPYKPFDKDVLKYTGDLITEAFPASYFKQIDTPRNYVLQRLVNEPDLNREQIEELFHRNYIAFTQYYMVAVLESRNYPDSKNTPQKEIHNVLDLRYKSSLFNFASTFYENDLVILLQANRPEDIELALQRLQDSLPDVSFCIGHGEKFEDIFSVYQQFRIARLTMQTGRMLLPDKNIYSFTELYFDIITSLLERENSAPLFIFEKLLKLLEVDHNKNTEYAKTVYEYILCNKNINRVSQKMSLHRNTVIYRINKAKELLDTDFENVNEVFQLFFSYKCLNTISRRQNAPDNGSAAR